MDNNYLMKFYPAVSNDGINLRVRKDYKIEMGYDTPVVKLADEEKIWQ